MTKPASSDQITFEALANKLRGDLVLADDPEYDKIRGVWNELYDPHPQAVAQCRGVADVLACIDVAREQQLPLAVRGGGHDYAGNSSCDDGLVIDLSPMDGIRIDPASKTARVGPGALWQDFYQEAQTFGLAIPGGPPTSGVAGVTLGGGIGYLSYKHGMTLDNLIGADVVTADGELVHANEEENPELFWALRGGGGNFGVVTSFEFQLHDVGPEVLAGKIFHPYDDMASALQFFRDYMADAPRELTAFALTMTIPPIDAFPEQYHGESTLCFVLCYSGSIDEGEEALRPLREYGDPIADTIHPQTFRAFKHADDEAFAAIDRYYSRSSYLDELTDDAIDTIVDHVEELPGTVTIIGLMPIQGKITDFDSDATAFPHRFDGYEFDVWAAWSDPEADEAIMDWSRRFHRAMSPHAVDGVYVNMLCFDEEERVREAYGDNYDRLVEVKTKWDPENLFQCNHNIEPSTR